MLKPTRTADRKLKEAELQSVAVYYGNRDVRLERRSIPRVGPGELLLQVTASGICGSDVMEWYRLPRAPVVLGHEVAGVVVDAGEDEQETPFQVGDRIVTTHHVPCMVCPLCLSGDHTQCPMLKSTHFDPGGFAEYIRIPYINVQRGTFKIPDGVPDDVASMTEPLGCVLRAQRKAGLQAGDAVLVIGVGVSGLLHIQAASALGAGLIVATDIDPWRLKMAERLGAAQTFQPTDPELSNDSEQFRIVIVCTGVRSAVEQSLQFSQPGGTILFFAPMLPSESLEIPFNRLFWQSGVRLTSSYGAAPGDLATALRLIESGRVHLEPLITHRIGLDHIQQGFLDVTAAGKTLKVIIDPRL